MTNESHHPIIGFAAASIATFTIHGAVLALFAVQVAAYTA